MGIRVGFDLCHAEGPFADLTSEAVTRVLAYYGKTTYGWSDDPNVQRVAAQFEAGGVAAVLLEPEDDVRAYEAMVAGGSGPDPRLLTLARRVLLEGQSALRIRSAEDALVVDRLAERLRCEGEAEIYPAKIDNPYLYVRHWEAVRDTVGGLSPRAGILWDFLLNGRGVGRPDGTFPYRSHDGVYRTSFWTLEECAFLGPLLVDAHTRARRDEPEHACAFESTRDAVVVAVRESLGLSIGVS